VGKWSGRVAPLHFSYLDISFTQEGTRIVGTACRWDGSVVPPYVSATGWTVFVDYPDVSIPIPGSAGQRCPLGDSFRGSFDGDTLRLTSTCDQAESITLTRGGSFCA
jgi:hypothetical protein